MIGIHDLSKVCEEHKIDLTSEQKTALIAGLNEELKSRYGNIEKANEIIFDLANIKACRDNKGLYDYKKRCKGIFDEKRKLNATRKEVAY